MARVLNTVNIAVLLILTFGDKCVVKSEINEENVKTFDVERNYQFKTPVDVSKAKRYARIPFNDAHKENSQPREKQDYNKDIQSQESDILKSNDKVVRKKRFLSPDDSMPVSTTITLPTFTGNDNQNSEFEKDLDTLFEGANNDTFELLPLPDSENYGASIETDFNPIATVEQAETLLLRNETKIFLGKLTDDIQRNIVEKHLLYCPHTPLCNFKYDDIHLYSFNDESTCRTCWCENCNDTELCCPDNIDVKKPHKLSNTECKYMSLKDSGNTCEVVNKCSPNLNSWLTDPCSSKENMEKFFDILPVTDITTNITYMNKKCAVCNQVPEATLVSWQPQLICVEQDAIPTVLKTEKDFIQFANDSRYCDITYFMPDESVYPKFCEQTITTCNVTGNWAVYDDAIANACSLYENIYTMKVDSFETKLYRNIFCALCNGEQPVYVTIPSYSYDGGSRQTYTFSGLLKFGGDEDKDKDKTDTDALCDDGFVYDSIKETCMELACSPLRMLKNNRCESLFSEIRNIIYTLNLRLFPVSEWNEYFDDLSSINNLLFTAINHRLEDLLIALNLFSLPEFDPYSYYSYFDDLPSPTICSMDLFHFREILKCVNGSCHITDYFEVEFRFKISDRHNIDDIVQLAADFEIDTLDIFVNVSVYKFEIQKRDYTVGNYYQGITLPGDCSNDTEVINLSKQKTCPLVSLSVDDNECYEIKEGVICSAINMTFKVSEYHFGINRSSLLVCSDVYLNQSANQERQLQQNLNKNVNSPNASITLSLICVIVSLVCLGMSFITFCLFPRLRTLPGKNNMSLIMSLMIAQTIFLISSFGQLESGSDGCKLVGILTHFFWLVAIFWMNICTFHVFRVFTGIETLSVDSEMKSFATYIAYTSVLPICLVVINIIVSIVWSEGTDIGYGKITCYISSEKMVGFTFGIPVGFVIISNLIMFAFFIYKIKTAPSVSKDVKNERNDIIIFAKLSTLTGFTWIFGFIYSWTDIEVFSYLFIILNATQGVFLFLSFVCNRRVLSMYKNRSFGVTSSSEAYRSRMTESTRQSSVKKA